MQKFLSICIFVLCLWNFQIGDGKRNLIKSPKISSIDLVSNDLSTSSSIKKTLRIKSTTSSNLFPPKSIKNSESEMYLEYPPVLARLTRSKTDRKLMEPMKNITRVQHKIMRENCFGIGNKCTHAENCCTMRCLHRFKMCVF